MGSSCSTPDGDPYWWGYLDDGKGWTARPKSEYMADPSYNKDLRRQLRQERKLQQQQRSMPTPAWSAPQSHGQTWSDPSSNSQGLYGVPGHEWNSPPTFDHGWDNPGMNDSNRGPPPSYDHATNPFLSRGHGQQSSALYARNGWKR